MKAPLLRTAAAAFVIAIGLATSPAAANDGDTLTWNTTEPEQLINWYGVRVQDPQGGIAQETWLWAREPTLRPTNKGKPGYAVPSGLAGYDICVPVFKLNKTKSENRRIPIIKNNKEQIVDGVVDFLAVERQPQHRLCVLFNTQTAAGYIDIVRVGSDFKVRVKEDGSNVAASAARVVGGRSDSALIDGKYHRCISAAPTTALPPTSSGPPTQRPTLPELNANEKKFLLEYEKTMYEEQLAKAKADPSGLSGVPSVAGDANSPKLTNEALYRQTYQTLKGRVDARRADPTLFLSEEDRALLTAEQLKSYLDEYAAAVRAGKSAEELRAITKKYYDIIYPPDKLSDRELAQLSLGEKQIYESELALSKTDQPATTLKVVSAWRGLVKRKAAGKDTYWKLFYPDDAALAPYGDAAVRAAIRAKMRAEGDAARTPEQNFQSRVNLGQRYYCTGLTIRSTIKPNDKNPKTLDLLKDLAANPSADRVKLDGQADRAVAPNPDPLCQGSLWNRERQDELLRDQQPTDTAGFKAGDIPAPKAEEKPKPGQWNDIINATKFGLYTAVIGFFVGGPIGAVLFGVFGMALSFGMSKVK